MIFLALLYSAPNTCYAIDGSKVLIPRTRSYSVLKPNKDDAGIEAVDAMTFPQSTYGRTRDQILFCRDIPCRDCQTRTEIATVHADCLHFYLANAPFPDKVRRLWAAAVSRYPWPGSPSLLLCPVLYPGCANRLATALPDLALLATLPVEIAANIWEIAHPSHLSRFGAVLGLVEVLSRADDDSVTLPLAHVREWHRGSGSYIAADESQSQGHWTWQVEADCLGIRRIERVDTVLSLQQPDNYRPQSIAFVRTDRDTPVQFQVCSCPSPSSYQLFLPKLTFRGKVWHGSFGTGTREDP